MLPAIKTSPLPALLLCMALAGCGEGPAPGATGRLVLGVTLEGSARARAASVVARVSDEYGRQVAVQALGRQGGQWLAEVAGVPAGYPRLVLEAFDARSELLCSDTVEALPLQAEASTLLLTSMQGTPPLPGAPGARPTIRHLRAAFPSEGGEVDLALSSRGAAPGASPRAEWTASAGVLEPGEAGGAVWAPPATLHGVALNLALRDLSGISRGMTMLLKNDKAKSPNKPKKGKAQISAQFNNWPVVTWAAAQRGQLPAGAVTPVEALATDSDGDPLTYQWSDGGCGGTFNAPASASTTWTAPSLAPASGSCDLQIHALDGQGGSGSGRVTVHVGALPSLDLCPRLHAVFQSLSTTTTKQPVTLRVVASDPEGAALSFSWKAAAGTISTPVSSSGAVVTSSEVTWAPPGAAGTYQVEVKVQDVGGASTSYQFQLEVDA